VATEAMVADVAMVAEVVEEVFGKAETESCSADWLIHKRCLDILKLML
jgi:hypothetical protein